MMHHTNRIRVAQSPGFTLIEVLVVISIITLLISMTLPAFSVAKWGGRKSKCLTQIRQIAISTDAYSVDHRGRVIHARADQVQIAIDPDEQELFADYGYPKQHWACPGRDYTPQIESSFGNQLVIGYQYFGGITQWRNQYGTFPSKSPVIREQAGPDWIIAADTSIKVDGRWGGGRPQAFGGMPSHQRGNAHPEGGNHATMDGSAKWVDFKDMYMIHSWSPNARMCFFRQDDMPEGLELENLVPATAHMD